MRELIAELKQRRNRIMTRIMYGDLIAYSAHH